MICKFFTVIDASAKPASGFVSGNNFWLGMPAQCNYVSHEVPIKLSNRYQRNMAPNLLTDVAPFEVEMRYAYVRHRSSLQVDFKILIENVLHLGLCLPKSCSNAQIHTLLQEFYIETDSRNNFKLYAEVLDVKDRSISPAFFMKTSVWLLVICIIFAMISRFAPNQQKDQTGDKLNADLGRKIMKCFNYEENKKAIRSREPSADAIKSISGLR